MFSFIYLTVASIYFIIMNPKMALANPVKIISITSISSLLVIIKSVKSYCPVALPTLSEIRISARSVKSISNTLLQQNDASKNANV